MTSTPDAISSTSLGQAVPEVQLIQPAPPVFPGVAATTQMTSSATAEALLPRAGFWLRMGALMIDLMLVACTCGLFTSLIPKFFHVEFGPWVLLVLAYYGSCLWHLRGTTIGGIICRIQVVRTDGRPLDWTTCNVRALGCILSGLAGGLGFLWIAFDDENESWHDKISGTTVVIVPRSRPLV